MNIEDSDVNDEIASNEKIVMITISLAYSPVDGEHHYLEVSITDGTTIYQALQQVGWLDKFIELNQWCEDNKEVKTPKAKHWLIGVYSRKQPLDYVLREFDRIEVYRPLTDDPMVKRVKRNDRED